MKHILRRTLAMLIVLVMVLGVLPAMPASAATVNYVTGSTDGYSNVIKNWGTRGELATFLSPNAEDFYEEQGVSYASLSAQAGSSNTSNVPSSQLYQSLYELMSDAHTTKNTYGDTRYLCQFTDIEKNGSESAQISTFYSGILVGPDWDGGATWSREHTWPDSKGGSSDTNNNTKTNESDIMMVRPVPQSENSSRGNKAYGVSSGYYFPNLTSYDVRGDVARTVLYVYVRWGTEQSAVLENMWGESGVMESLDVLLDWIEVDPVDTWEMGRNDSVQSITGTRNVFVDYPELAFLLFDEEIPEMTTPSGNAGAQVYQITARSNNTAYGTVSVNGSVITASPATGYQVAGYTVTSGTASVVQSGNTFVVKASSDCTITVNFAAVSAYTVRVKENGVIRSTQSVYANSTFTLPAFSGQLPEGYTFYGWSTAEVTDDGAKPTVYAPGAVATITGNTDFYAVAYYMDSETESTDVQWVLVTDASQIGADSQVIIAAKETDVAMSTTQNSNNRGEAAVTKTGNNLTFDTAVQIFTLAKNDENGSYVFYAGSSNLYAVNNSSNYLRTQTQLTDGGYFYITPSADGTCAITSAAYTSTASGVGQVPLQYNSSSKLFACYPKATQKALSLYVAQSTGSATVYVTAWEGAECKHTDEVANYVAPTCTQQGYTEFYCADCGEFLYVEDYEAALGHTEVITAGYAATLTQEGLSDGKHCSVCNEVLAIQQTIPCLASVDSWGLVLADDLTVKFKIYVAPSISTAAKVHISVANVSTTYSVADLTAAVEDFYYASVKVAAAQMGDSIAVYISNGTEVSVTKTYSVLQYATALLADVAQSKYHALLKEMLNYGAAAQTWFGYRTDALVNTQISGAGATAVPESTSQQMSFVGSAAGISYYGASLVYREKLAVRFYFEGAVDNIRFLSGNTEFTPVAKNGMHYVEIGGILPQDLDEQLTLTATDAAGNTFTVVYSPMNYIVRMYSKGDTAQKNLMTALYNYHLAAQAVVQA